MVAASEGDVRVRAVQQSHVPDLQLPALVKCNRLRGNGVLFLVKFSNTHQKLRERKN